MGVQCALQQAVFPQQKHVIYLFSTASTGDMNKQVSKPYALAENIVHKRLYNIQPLIYGCCVAVFEFLAFILPALSSCQCTEGNHWLVFLLLVSVRP